MITLKQIGVILAVIALVGCEKEDECWTCTVQTTYNYDAWGAEDYTETNAVGEECNWENVQALNRGDYDERIVDGTTVIRVTTRCRR